MALDLERLEGIEELTRRTTRLWTWVVSKPDDRVCYEWAIRFVCDFRPAKLKPTAADSSLLTPELVHGLASNLRQRLIASASLVAVVNPALQSALATLSTAKNLTPSELVALDCLIGSAPVQNEFDIEAFYAKEDELDN